MIRIAAIALMFALSPAAHAQQSGTTAPATPDQPEESPASDPQIVVEGEKPKRVCETVTGTGSIIPRRVCRTPEQVAADEERAGIIKGNMSRDRNTAQHVAAARANR